MNKKVLFILAGILVLVAIIFIVVMKSGNKSSVQNTNQPSATLPTTPPATLPTETENSQQNIQDIKKSLDNIVQQPIPEKVVQEGSDLVKFQDQNKKPIPLTDFESATGVVINKELRNYLDNTDYRIFYCPGMNNKKDFGVYFGDNVQKAYANLYPDTIKWMKDWEKTMFSDLHAVLLPDTNFSAEELNQNLEFKDGKYRYAEIRLPGGKMSSINYHVSDNGVIISVSPSCLDKLVQIYEPLEP